MNSYTITDDFNTIMQSDEFASEYEAWLDEVTKLNEEIEKRHGSPYDRGMADSYYRRGIIPHYYEGASFYSNKITDLNKQELFEYLKGYNDNEASGDFKDWGFTWE